MKLSLPTENFSFLEFTAFSIHQKGTNFNLPVSLILRILFVPFRFWTLLEFLPVSYFSWILSFGLLCMYIWCLISRVFAQFVCVGILLLFFRVSWVIDGFRFGFDFAIVGKLDGWCYGSWKLIDVLRMRIPLTLCFSYLFSSFYGGLRVFFFFFFKEKKNYAWLLDR